MRKAKKENERKKSDIGEANRERERKKGEREREKKRFPGVPTVGARLSQKKSRSTHRELRVGTKILEFRQAPRGREFSYLGYF